ncbi:MAG: Ribosomal small subunit pseudouridine synthase A [Candidatus Carbobacillus altaicus]|uniref:Pseudouridine synthase n=1 Tax=Candidatus Carbonibacillus altaicus TaxID=2163959 RepID=A0A2R6Y4C0_9BACL|nr:MAG: Ribosomal small subunit pseudouridine synthase A [Candidatus Carbobacillus altaicus]
MRKKRRRVKEDVFSLMRPIRPCDPHPDMAEKKMLRLDRLLHESGFGTRRDIKKWLKDGAVSVNGMAVLDHGLKIDPERDHVTVFEEAIQYEPYRYIMVHKPQGVITATRDAKEAVVLDLIPPEWVREGLAPVGRLDKDTTGLVLLTDDGHLAHRLTAPRYEVEKIYAVRVARPLQESDRLAFQKGLPIGGGEVAKPARLEIDPREPRWALVALREGKMHQVKRMFETVGTSVLRLHRLSIGPLVLEETLPEGSARLLRRSEVVRLYEAAGYCLPYFLAADKAMDVESASSVHDSDDPTDIFDKTIAAFLKRLPHLV